MEQRLETGLYRRLHTERFVAPSCKPAAIMIECDLKSEEQTRLTDNDALDGVPSISPDGKWLTFSSTRDSTAGSHSVGVFLQDISSLRLGPP